MEFINARELHEIEIELKGGDAPDIVAFRHDVPFEFVRAIADRYTATNNHAHAEAKRKKDGIINRLHLMIERYVKKGKGQ